MTRWPPSWRSIRTRSGSATPPPADVKRIMRRESIESAVHLRRFLSLWAGSSGNYLPGQSYTPIMGKRLRRVFKGCAVAIAGVAVLAFGALAIAYWRSDNDCAERAARSPPT